MRRFTTIAAFLLIATTALSQNEKSGMLSIREIPVTGLVLDSGWLFRPGDDSQWAEPGYTTDTGWIAVDPTDEIHHLPDIKKAGSGWLRLQFNVDSSLRGQNFAMLVSGLGAMEIYLNGKRAYEFGRPSADYREETTRLFTNNLLSLHLDTIPQQLIAVRYSFHPKNLYVKFANTRPVLRIELKEINQGINENIKENNFESTLRTIQVSFYLPLGFLLLFLYMSFRPQKEYLYAGIFCLSLFLAILFHILALREPVTVNQSNSFLLVTQVLYIIGAISFIHSMYVLYKFRKNIFFYLIVAYGLFTIPYYFISYDNSGFVNAFFFPVINLEFLRLNIIAVSRRRKGAKVLLITSIVFALTIVSYIIAAINQQAMLSALFQGISFIIPGLGLSIFYAGEFARTAVAERNKTAEVEKLSLVMIEKEREKQQILSEQNLTLEKQVAERTKALEESLQDLKDTEQQLIQREKMASLGELTAGIAHEIQNPLNFVNNFSEVNNELLKEFQSELDIGNLEEARAIAKNISTNSEKINHHGKRADSIVKGMLLHSRASSGQKELTDINALAEEYLRLSYHGLRAKDKSFSAKFGTAFDADLPKINVVPQELGRVILNMINNAFYAVSEKKRRSQPGYEPVVTVGTKRAGDRVVITIRDNGNGMPEKMIEKIFQPFFTTKPAGQGTGLGLSISYDIVKAHGGELKVDSREGEGTEFAIVLPLNHQS